MAFGKMVKTKKTILVSKLKFDSEFEKRSPALSSVQKIAARTSRDALSAILIAFPIIVRQTERGLVVISGKRSAMLVRALLRDDQKVEVTEINGSDDYLELFPAIDDVFASLFFHTDLDVLAIAAERHIKNRSIHRLAIDLARKEHWKEILRSERQVEAAKSGTDEIKVSEKKRRGRKVKALATDGEIGANKVADAASLDKDYQDQSVASAPETKNFDLPESQVESPQSGESGIGSAVDTGVVDIAAVEPKE